MQLVVDEDETILVGHQAGLAWPRRCRGTGGGDDEVGLHYRPGCQLNAFPCDAHRRLSGEHHDATLTHDALESRADAAGQRICRRDQGDTDIELAKAMLDSQRQFNTACARADEGDAGPLTALMTDLYLAGKCCKRIDKCFDRTDRN